jgi:hypothetical protein
MPMAVHRGDVKVYDALIEAPLGGASRDGVGCIDGDLRDIRARIVCDHPECDVGADPDRTFVVTRTIRRSAEVRVTAWSGGNELASRKTIAPTPERAVLSTCGPLIALPVGVRDKGTPHGDRWSKGEALTME